MIDKIYIEEAIRIRKEYLRNLNNVNVLEKIYKDLLTKIEDVKLKLSNISNEVENNLEHNYKEKDIVDMVVNLSDEIDIVLKDIKPYNDNIKKLDDEQRVLYNLIKEKYPNMTDDELYAELVPIIREFDYNFIE